MRIDHKDIVKINYWIGKFYEDIIKVVDQIEACIKILEHKVHEGIHLSCQKKYYEYSCRSATNCQ